jgi:hypothetical protein
MASPTVDGKAVNSTVAAGATSGTVTLTTTNANDIIVIAVALENTTAQGSTNKVTSVAKTSGTGTVGSFTQRSASDGNSSNGNAFQGLEVWWAVATTALTSAVFTVHSNIATDDMVIVAFGVSGVGSTSAPWDPNASLTVANINTSTVATTQTSKSTSTTNADDLIVWFSCDTNGVAPAAPTGFSAVESATNALGTLEVSLGVHTKSVSATQTSQTYTSSSSASWVVVMDALTADAPATTSQYTSSFFDPVPLKRPLESLAWQAPGTSPSLASPYVQAPLFDAILLKKLPDGLGWSALGTDPSLSTTFATSPFFDPTKVKQPLDGLGWPVPGTDPKLSTTFATSAFFDPQRLRPLIVDYSPVFTPLAVVALAPVQAPFFEAIRLKPNQVEAPPIIPGTAPAISIAYQMREFFELTKIKQPIINIPDVVPNNIVGLAMSWNAFFDPTTMIRVRESFVLFSTKVGATFSPGWVTPNIVIEGIAT